MQTSQISVMGWLMRRTTRCSSLVRQYYVCTLLYLCRVVVSVAAASIKSAVRKVEIVKCTRLAKVNEYHDVIFHSRKDVHAPFSKNT